MALSLTPNDPNIDYTNSVIFLNQVSNFTTLCSNISSKLVDSVFAIAGSDPILQFGFNIFLQVYAYVTTYVNQIATFVSELSLVPIPPSVSSLYRMIVNNPLFFSTLKAAIPDCKGMNSVTAMTASNLCRTTVEGLISTYYGLLSTCLSTILSIFGLPNPFQLTTGTAAPVQTTPAYYAGWPTLSPR
ncbi:uncharacterized protein LOC129741474 [Uranotaenia lowii]|uniref:uncharacterized protein LOC129741474 n=1 Tax=Uranotaenia lowii TaxID=190385 RepID=UPI00247A0731|nr:uncharacterized protein LOC129741474 [Uranotaenia lowii]